MKRIKPVIVLMILPLLLIMLSIFYRASRGDYFLTWQYDPSYVYLINSLNIAQLKGYGSGFIVHPGITVQLAGAIIVKVLHSLNSLNIDMALDVFSRPEFYLWRINLIFNVMVGMALFVLGFLTYKKLGIYAAIILQSTPFYFSVTYLVLSDVNSEIFLVLTTLLLIAVSIIFVNNEHESKKNSLIYAIVYGLICGFGLATKLTFLPILIIPLILIRGLSFKSLFLFVTVFSFFIFVYPAISSANVNEFTEWVKNLATRSGRYGTGSDNYVDTAMFIQNLKIIFTIEILFSFSYLLMLILLILRFFPKYKIKITTNKYYRLLIAIFLTITIQVLSVAKHYNTRYVITSFLLSVLGLFIINSILSVISPRFFEKKRYIYIGLILFCFSIVQVNFIVQELKLNILRRNESNRYINRYEKHYKGLLTVNSYGHSSRESGLGLAVEMSGPPKELYNSILKKLYPNYVHYNKFSENFYQAQIDNLKDQVRNTNKFIFQCDDVTMIDSFMKQIMEITNKPNATYKLLFSNSLGESIFEITLEP